MSYAVFFSPPPDFSPFVIVTACYCELEDKLLFLKRQEGKSYPNTWHIPGGKLESGETPRDTIIREMQEETGFSVAGDDLHEFGQIYIRVDGKDYHMHLFRKPLLEAPQINLALQENKEARWMTIAEAVQHPFIPGGREALSFYQRKILD